MITNTNNKTLQMKKYITTFLFLTVALPCRTCATITAKRLLLPCFHHQLQRGDMYKSMLPNVQFHRRCLLQRKVRRHLLRNDNHSRRQLLPRRGEHGRHQLPIL